MSGEKCAFMDELVGEVMEDEKHRCLCFNVLTFEEKTSMLARHLISLRQKIRHSEFRENP
jgi:hypothetical protein